MTSIFTKILAGEIPGEILYKNDEFFVIRDINPEDVTHLLIIPKQEIVSLTEVDDKLTGMLGRMMLFSKKIAEDLGLEEGYKVMINIGDYSEIDHLHVHVISKRG